MDPIDEALTEAWGRVAARVRADRLEALRRAMRRTGAVLSRPIRPWCLCLRASDTRLNVHAWVPKYLPEEREPHEIAIFSDTIRELCKPVTVPWPGWDLERAAHALGRHHTGLRAWLKHGVFRVRHVPASMMSKQGPPVPIVWSPTALDPNADLGRAPDPVWGSMWQHLWERVPDDLEFLVERVPLTMRRGGREHHLGWQFVCPGLPAQLGMGQQAASSEQQEGGGTQSAACGRRVDRLYIPLRAWTLLDALGLDDPLDVRFPFGNQVPGGKTQASETRNEHRAVAGTFAPACRHCHKMLGFSLVDYKGWNVFVWHLSAGLLRGSEVRRPAGTYRRVRGFRRRRGRAAPQRERVLNLILRGVSPGEIAERLGVRLATVRGHELRLYRKHGVRRRADLCARLGAPDRRPMPRRRSQVLRGLMDGLSAQEIADRLKLGRKAVHSHCVRLYRQHGVHCRAALVARVRGMGAKWKVENGEWKSSESGLLSG